MREAERTADMPRDVLRRWRDPASLGAKLVLILTATGLAGAIGITLLLAAIITPSFNRLEERSIAGQVERTQAVLAEYGVRIESAARDYGDWDASYTYIDRPSRAFEREGFSSAAMSNLGVQGMAYLAPDGRVLVARWLDGGTFRHPAMWSGLVAAITRIHPTQTLDGRVAGHCYLRVGGEIVGIGVAQVRRSDGTGAPRGFVAMARVLTSEQVAALLGLDARIEPGAVDRVQTRTPNRGWADISVPIIGSDGRPVASVRFVTRRDVSLLGRRMLLLAVAGSTLLLLIVLMVLRRMIARQVLRPLHRVEAHMQRVRALGSLSPLEEDGRRDEIGALGRAFNAMLRQLSDLREQIEAQSFALGRSESAVAVMHNVRNALNPVSTILSQGIAQTPPVDRTMLDRAIAELSRDDIPAARRARLAAFTTAGVDAWSIGREAMRRELTVGREAMAHVLEIIGQQQQRAHERLPLEVCDVTEIVARNAAIARYTDGAAIAFSFPSTPHRVLANRVILSQVIGNLLGNAAEAIAAAGRGQGSVTVSLSEQGDTVTVAIRDDGEGFDLMTGQALFQRGFSTRSHKSGGLGLHWCANSMTAMDGALRLESAGSGKGAVAVLTLRAAEAVRAAA